MPQSVNICIDEHKNRTERGLKMKFRVEFGFGENVQAVDEWQTIDELNAIEAENYEEAAKEAANADGLENAMFRVCEFGKLERNGNWKYFSF